MNKKHEKFGLKVEIFQEGNKVEVVYKCDSTERAQNLAVELSREIETVFLSDEVLREDERTDY